MNHRDAILGILASARGAGHTAALLDAVLEPRARRIDLLRLKIEDYRYDSTPCDDFIPVVREMLNCDCIIIATPVYWYAMSALAKRLLDRMSELLDAHKALGRGLAGRRLMLLASGSDPELPEGFCVPFRDTAAYFGMTYDGALYVPMPNGTGDLRKQESNIAAFSARAFRERTGQSTIGKSKP
ncbi:MAG: NAD(P)H-dependent oxidoreductase [Pseudomonadota bacterium]|jgi:multimeric flavodoxin WrbA|nr:NAD(P)H-dependent oxidoreductase [Pseudomonadota bacterium]